MVLVGAVALGCRPRSMVMQLGNEDGNGYMRSDLAEAMHTGESIAYSKAGCGEVKYIHYSFYSISFVQILGPFFLLFS